jgi:hypothetical protein
MQHIIAPNIEYMLIIVSDGRKVKNVLTYGSGLPIALF